MKALLVDTAIFSGMFLLVVLPLVIVGCAGIAVFMPEHKPGMSQLIINGLVAWVVTLFGLIWLDRHSP